MRIPSGGQTGADSGALDAALYAKVPHGGRCPSSRRAEDGVIPAVYQHGTVRRAERDSRKDIACRVTRLHAEIGMQPSTARMTK